MKKMFAAAMAALSLTAFCYAGGLEVGSDVSAFYVKDVTGPAAGNKLCYRCRYGARPVVSIFTRNINNEVTSLIQKVDATVGQHQDKDMKAFVVLLTDEPEAKEAQLKQIAEQTKVNNTPLTTFDSVAGPAPYKLSQDAEVTIMMWVDGKLKVNEEFKVGELTADKVATVVSKTSQILN